MINNNSTANIKEIAKLAEVSTATVSRVINTPAKVKASTRNRVNKVIEQMNYIPKTSVPTNSNIIVVMTDISNPFYRDIFMHLTKYAEDTEYHVIGYDMNICPESEACMFEYFKKMQYAGIVLPGLTRLKDVHAEVPVVLLDDTSLANGNYYNITSDNKTAVRMLIDYLIRLNHKKIGFISGDVRSSAGRERETEFTSYMNELDLPCEHIFHGDFSQKSGHDAFDYFYSLPEIPTAVIAANDEMAKGFIIRASNMGVNIPQDISICGIDALENDYFSPKITSVRQDSNAMAKATIDYIRNYKSKSFNNPYMIPVAFSPGNTCYKVQE